MRYFKSAAFLLAILSGSVPSLSRAASATPEDAGAMPQSAEQKFASSNLSVLLNGAQGAPNRALLDGRKGPTATSVPSAPAFSQIPPSQPAQKLASRTKQAMDLEDFRQLIESSDPVAQESDEAAEPATPPAAQNTPAEDDLPTDDLPTLEEGTPPAEAAEEAVEEDTDLIEAAPVVPEAGDAETLDDLPDDELPEELPEELPPDSAGDAEIGGFPDSLLADPNPLNVPTVIEEVDIERNPVVTLEQAVDLAYRNNQALQAALLQLEQAEAAVAEQRAALVPSVTLGADLTNTQQGSQDQTTLGGTVQVEYDLLTGGQRSASIRAAELQQQVSALAVEAQQEQLRLVTANLYYALQESGEQIRINESFVNEAERNLRDAELRQEVGVGTRFDVLRADVQLANALQALVQSRFNQDIARRDIARLLNLPSTAGLQTTPVEKAENWPLSLEESILLALQNRAELEQQLRQAEISEQQRRIALSAIRPRVSLFATYGLENILDSSNALVETGEFNDSYTFGARFNMRVFDGGAARAAARQQEIAGAIAEEQFSENADQFRFDVEQAFFNLQANEENIATSRVAVAQAEEALNLANLRLQAGVGTQLDVLSAQSELTEAEVNSVTAILGYNRALAAIQRAVSSFDL